MTLIESELRAALRAEAAVHRPDREAMLDRITQTAMRNQAGQRRSPRLRVTGAAVAVAAVLGGGGFAQWAVAGDGEPSPGPTPPTVVVTVEPVPSGPAPSTINTPSGTPIAPPSRSPKSKPSSRSASPPAPTGATATGATTPAGTLGADGSVRPDGDSQASSAVTVTARERLTALEVTIRIAKTPGLAGRGGSQQVPGASVTSTVTEEPGVLVYRFVLSSGDTLEPGTYTFFARYTYPKGVRDAGGDTYAAAATTAAGAVPTASGDFR